MALHHDLLEQAAHLATRETRRPRQASLRRAVSAAYYALFHLLIDEGARRFSASKPDGLRLRVRRAFDHGDMRNVCKSFLDGQKAILKNKDPGQPPPATRQLLTFPLEPVLVAVIQAFVDLREARDEADYDLGKQWNRLDVLAHVQVARQAFADWARIRTVPNATVFLAALLLQRQWGR